MYEVVIRKLQNNASQTPPFCTVYIKNFGGTWPHLKTLHYRLRSGGHMMSTQCWKDSEQFRLKWCPFVWSSDWKNTKRRNPQMQKSFGNWFAGCVIDGGSHLSTSRTVNKCKEKTLAVGWWQGTHDAYANVRKTSICQWGFGKERIYTCWWIVLRRNGTEIPDQTQMSLFRLGQIERSLKSLIGEFIPGWDMWCKFAKITRRLEQGKKGRDCPVNKKTNEEILYVRKCQILHHQRGWRWKVVIIS